MKIKFILILPFCFTNLEIAEKQSKIYVSDSKILSSTPFQLKSETYFEEV